MANWKPPKDMDGKDYVEALLKRLAEVDLSAKKALQVTGQLFLNLKTAGGNRYDAAHDTDQWTAYAKDVRPGIKDMLKAIGQLNGEYDKYGKHMKKKKAKPIKRAEQAWKKYKQRADAYVEQVGMIERHARR